ncbi:MAG: DNA repair protein RecO [Minisyncoccia bacterium]
MSYRVYTTKGIVLKKKNSGEQNSFLYILTKDLGLIIASARSTRSSKSKLKGLIEEFSHGDFSFVKGKNGWHLTNVSENGNFFFQAPNHSRKTLAQMAAVLLKMIQGEEPHKEVYSTVVESFKFLTEVTKDHIHIVEVLSVLRIMYELGYVRDDNEVTDFLKNDDYSSEILQQGQDNKIKIVALINRALKESQL